MPDQKLVGQNYTTPDLVAKVTGRAKYAEDYRADGMLFAKLLLSPMPHARVRPAGLHPHPVAHTFTSLPAVERPLAARAVLCGCRAVVSPPADPGASGTSRV